jgi:RNA polymerase sigma factor (sigma-70 family)
MDLDGRFFRREAGRLTAALTRLFGVRNLALAEDVTQDVLCRALEVWKFHGPPPNPAAWLMTAAKNRAVDVLRRERTARTFAPELARWLETEWTLRPTVDALFAADAIQDDQLRMMLSCCHPRLPEAAQLAVILQVLCGFSVDEIASAFLDSPAAVEKRVTRAKKVLAAAKSLFDLADGREVAARLPVVHRALYLLFNEGYHGASPASAVRGELVQEAMRLVSLLLDHPAGRTPATGALAALMCLHAARMPARLDDAGDLTPFFEQDRARWDASLLAQGRRLLDQSAAGAEVTPYHIEAAIAGVHAGAASAGETDWGAIVQLYDALLALRPSPVVALHRAIAIAQQQGPARGLEAIAGIEGRERLEQYPFYAAALGEMVLGCGQAARARERFRQALALARNPTERRSLEKRLAACDEGRQG